MLRALGLLLLAPTAGCGSIAATPTDAGADASPPGDAGPAPDDGGATLPDGGPVTLPDGSVVPDGGTGPANWDSPSALWDISTWN